MKVLFISVIMVSLSSCFIFNISAQVLQNGLVLYFSFDEGSGNTVKDLSGNNNNGTFAGGEPAPKWTDGMYGKALEFEPGETRTSGGGYIVVADSPSLSLTEAITVAVWVYPKDLSHFAHVIVAHWCTGEGCNTSRDLAYTLETHGKQIGGNNEVYILLNWGAASASTVTTLKVGKWQHIAFTYDRKTVKIYYNGVMEGESEFNSLLWDSTQNFQIARTDRDDVIFGGRIDEVKVWNRALSSEEIVLAMSYGLAVMRYLDKLTTTWGMVKGHI